jgi:hypothetical protein
VTLDAAFDGLQPSRLNVGFTDHLFTTHNVGHEAAELGGALAQVSVETGAWLARRVAKGRPLRETTVTDNLLSKLEQLVPTFDYEDFGGLSRETRTGADLEWWVEGRTRWFAFWVQAKRAFYPSASSPHYDLAYRVSGGPQLQASRLVAAARRAAIPAIYVLYNATDVGHTYTAEACGSPSYCNLPSAVEGVTTISANQAERLAVETARRGSSVTDVDLADVADYAMPLTCLIGCPASLSAGYYRWPGSDLLTQDTWDQLGFDGAVDPADSAFQAAVATLVLYSHEDTLEYEQIIALVGEGVRETAPAYVADMSEASYVTAVERSDVAPADWPGRVAVLRRRPDDRGRRRGGLGPWGEPNAAQ